MFAVPSPRQIIIFPQPPFNTFLPLKNDISDTYSSPMSPCGVCSPHSVNPYLVRLNPVNINIQILIESDEWFSPFSLSEPLVERRAFERRAKREIKKMNAWASAIQGKKLSGERIANLEKMSECPALQNTDSHSQPNSVRLSVSMSVPYYLLYSMHTRNTREVWVGWEWDHHMQLQYSCFKIRRRIIL